MVGAVFNRDLSDLTITLIMWKGGPPYPSIIVGTVADPTPSFLKSKEYLHLAPNPDKPEMTNDE